jgi:hypothetical protein
MVELKKPRSQVSHTPKSRLEWVAILLAILAIAFAAIQFIDSRHIKDQIEDLLKSISTRYVGSFPDNMDQVSGIVDSSHKALTVLVDFPGYGFYFKPDKSDDYIKKIIRLRQANPEIKIRMLFYSSAAQGQKLREEEFPKEHWQAIKNSARFDDFFATYHAEIPRPENYDDFIKYILMLHKRYEIMLCHNGAEVRHLGYNSVFFWLEDSNNAIVAINNKTGSERELSFYTRDGKLIDSLQSMFDGLWNSKTDPEACEPARPGGRQAHRLAGEDLRAKVPGDLDQLRGPGPDRETEVRAQPRL